MKGWAFPLGVFESAKVDMLLSKEPALAGGVVKEHEFGIEPLF
jgi:hypothetical protein